MIPTPGEDDEEEDDDGPGCSPGEGRKPNMEEGSSALEKKKDVAFVVRKRSQEVNGFCGEECVRA